MRDRQGSDERCEGRPGGVAHAQNHRTDPPPALSLRVRRQDQLHALARSLGRPIHPECKVTPPLSLRVHNFAPAHGEIDRGCVLLRVTESQKAPVESKVPATACRVRVSVLGSRPRREAGRTIASTTCRACRCAPATGFLALVPSLGRRTRGRVGWGERLQVPGGWCRGDFQSPQFIPYGGHVHASDETRALHSPVRRAQNRTCAKEV